MHSREDRLLLWYAAYRIVVAIALTPSFLQNNYLVDFGGSFLSLPYYVIFSYLMISVIQLILLAIIPNARKVQITLLSLLDVVFIGFVVLLLGGNQPHVAVLVVTNILIINLVQAKEYSLKFTLLAIILVVYVPLLQSGADEYDRLAESTLMLFSFVAVFFIAKLLTKTLSSLEESNRQVVHEIASLQEISQELLLATDTGYLVYGGDGHIALSNASAKKLLSLSDDDVGLPSTLRENIEKLTPNYALQSFQFRHNQQDINATLSMINIKGDFYKIVSLESTDKLNLKVQQAKLMHLGRLSASIAHEIRNPLASIVQANSLYLKLPSDQHAMLNRVISEQSARINNIIHSTLDLAKNKSASKETINFELFMRELIDSSLRNIKNTPILDIKTSENFEFDRIHLSQILINLISNADRYQDSDLGELSICYHCLSNALIIDVINFGVPIPVELREQLFEPFYTTDENGHGLGLYLVKMLCELNDAKVLYFAEENKSVFRVILEGEI